MAKKQDAHHHVYEVFDDCSGGTSVGLFSTFEKAAQCVARAARNASEASEGIHTDLKYQIIRHVVDYIHEDDK